MRTTLDLPEDLIRTAMKLTGARTKTGLIVRALRDIVRRNKIAGLKEYKGKVNLDIDLSALRKRRCPSW